MATRNPGQKVLPWMTGVSPQDLPLTRSEMEHRIRRAVEAPLKPSGKDAGGGAECELRRDSLDDLMRDRG